MSKLNDYVTTLEASKILGFTQDHVRRLIQSGKIKAERRGRIWFIQRKALTKIERQRFPRSKKDVVNDSILGIS